MPFLGRYNDITKLLCYTIVVVQNVLLISDQIVSVYFNGVSNNFAFNILAFFNLFIALLILVVFLLRDLPLIVRLLKYDLSERVGLLS